MLCRSPDRAEAAMKEIQELTNNDNISILLADVGELSQVRRVVKELQAKESKIDCLICNAGVLLNDRKETSEGHEMTFASHFLGGSYLLSQLLLPQLKAAKESRVVFVTSGGMLITKFPDWETVTSTGKQKESYDGNFAYGYAKRGQVLLAERLTVDEPSVKWVTAHPGWAGTAAVDDAFGENKKYLEPLRSTWEGAEGIGWLMAAQAASIDSGALYLDRKTQKKHIAGAFMTEGSYTKNKPAEVDEMMANLKKAAGL
jgi:dehydrogenase/reductase SDR family protein 12